MDANGDRREAVVGRSLLTDEQWCCTGRQLGLSPRELEVVQHIFEGKKMSVIARDLDLSLGTVKTYAQRVYHKVGVSDQRELTLAIVAGLLERSGAAGRGSS